MGSKGGKQAGKSETATLNPAIYELKRAKGPIGPFVLIALNKYITVVL